MRQFPILVSFLLLGFLPAVSQNPAAFQRPRLVVGLVVDQMRWDFLYRYYNRYLPQGGFKRLMDKGFNCENTMIPYTPTVTACGHACIYTGGVPATHGIAGNTWWDVKNRRTVYCTEDTAAKPLGGTVKSGQMSPRNLLATTICDELKLATNFRSKVFGIALKDRGGILPAGHTADAAYWYDGVNGNFMSSDYYFKQLPDWVNRFNNRKLADSLMRLNWNTLYPLSSYTQSTDDTMVFEGKYAHTKSNGFPHELASQAGKNYDLIRSTPWGNTLTTAFARATIEGERMGADSITDFLAISYSSPDYIGHQFGPNSIENEDDYLRLDRELGAFLDYLDKQVGRGRYLLFLSADHGVAHVPGFMELHRIPGGVLKDEGLAAKVKAAFGHDSLIDNISNYQVFLNHRQIRRLGLNRDSIIDFVIDQVKMTEGISTAFRTDGIAMATLPQVWKERAANGYFPGRCGDVQFIPSPQWVSTGKTGTSHGVWNPYDAHIPLLWYGQGIQPGRLTREVYMTDIAPTLAALLRIQAPSGSIGKVIEEVGR